MSTFAILNPVDNKDTGESPPDQPLDYCTIISSTTRISRNKFTQLWVCDRCGTLGVDNHTSREKCDHEAVSLRFAEIF